jgi:hypothetical protein
MLARKRPKTRLFWTQKVLAPEKRTPRPGEGSPQIEVNSTFV